MSLKPTLMEHQIEPFMKMRNGTVLTGGVGSGKTITSLFYYYEKVMGGTVGDPFSIKTPVDLYVFTTARKRESLDWQKEAAAFLIGRERESSAGGVMMTVDSYNNIQKYKDVKNAFIILDEQRMVGNGAWSKTFIKLAKQNQWVMLSATPADRWEDYATLFIANGFYKNVTQFKREHMVYSYYGNYPKLERYVGVNKLLKLKYSILIEMPYKRHTTRYLHTVPVNYDADQFERVVKKRWHVYEERPLKDVSELFSVMRKVVNSDRSRLEAVSGLLKTHPRLIVFYNFDYELEALRTLANSENLEDGTVISGTTTSKTETDSTMSYQDIEPYEPRSPYRTPILSMPEQRTNGQEGLTTTQYGTKSESSAATGSVQQLVVAEWNGHKHEPVPETERWVYLVQYQAGAEAWNCITTDAVCFYSLNYSYKIFEQSQGRIDRLNTPYTNLHYYILMSKSPMDRAVSKALRNKTNFNEKEFTIKAA